MGDPVTMAVIGGSVGAMMNKKDPLKGAMLGAMGGYGGATLLPTLGAGTSATGAMTGTNAAATGANLTAVPAFGGQAFQVGANAVPSAGVFSGGGTAALGGASPITAAGPSTGLIPSSMAPAPTFMENMTGGLNSIGQYAQQNPVLSQMAMQTGQSLLSNQQQQPAPAGLMRGNPSQVQMPQYQVGVPQVSLI